MLGWRHVQGLASTLLSCSCVSRRQRERKRVSRVLHAWNVVVHHLVTLYKIPSFSLSWSPKIRKIEQ
ncbi:uncharacterized protein DS421_16g548670 [Arachis hypogaea]|nr:uncharacterized protein DS421_16g548670 [Arachis hypogaea]